MEQVRGRGELSPEGDGQSLAEISRRVVQLHKQCYGKGPTKARTYWDEEVITVVLRGGLTPDELTLRDAGRGEAVRAYRMQFQKAMRGRFKHELERLTGRTVIAVMSGFQLEDPEMATEVFVLEPADEGSPGIEANARVEDLSSVRARL